MNQAQIKEIEDCYTLMTKGVANPQAVNRCYKFITGMDTNFRGIRGKEQRIVNFVLMGGLMDAKRALKEDDSKVILTEVGKDAETNFDGVKIVSESDEEPQDEVVDEVHVLRHKGQSHHEDNAPREVTDNFNSPIIRYVPEHPDDVDFPSEEDPDGLPTLTEEELEIPLVFDKEKAAAVQAHPDDELIADYELDDVLTELFADLSSLEDNDENKRKRQTLKMQITKRKKIIDGQV